MRLVSVGQDHIGFVEALCVELIQAGIRADIDVSNDKVGKKIRDAATSKIPWTIVLGAKEVEGGDYKVNVFGQEEDLMIPATQLIDRAQQLSKLPL